MLGADVSVKQIGLGLAVAVLIDATVVRLVLVPAVMETARPGQLVAAAAAGPHPAAGGAGG